jgi:hypothetical protein
MADPIDSLSDPVIEQIMDAVTTTVSGLSFLTSARRLVGQPTTIGDLETFIEYANPQRQVGDNGGEDIASNVWRLPVLVTTFLDMPQEAAAIANGRLEMEKRMSRVWCHTAKALLTDPYQGLVGIVQYTELGNPDMGFSEDWGLYYVTTRVAITYQHKFNDPTATVV